MLIVSRLTAIFWCRFWGGVTKVALSGEVVFLTQAINDLSGDADRIQNFLPVLIGTAREQIYTGEDADQRQGNHQH